MSDTVDLDAYLARVDHSGPLDRDAATLHALHRAHLDAIPYENLDLMLGRPIRVDLASLQEKLVDRRRGGYCFEHNTLFAGVLAELGFPVTLLTARVWLRGRIPTAPRTHMVLRVEADGEPWIADVGFGSAGPLTPLPLRPGHEERQGGWSFRLIEDDLYHVLQTHHLGEWRDLYGFTLEPHDPVDIELANHWTSTHPTSMFRMFAIANRVGEDLRLRLVDRSLAEIRPDGEETTTIAGDEELLAVLDERFGLSFPPGTRFVPPVSAG